MENKDQEQRFLAAVNDELDKSCDGLDGHTLSRLNSIRHAALEQGSRHRGRALLAPFGGLVTACLLVVVVSMFYNNQPDAPVPGGNNTAIEDLDILTAAEGLEFFENFEFYQWLEENETSV